MSPCNNRGRLPPSPKLLKLDWWQTMAFTSPNMSIKGHHDLLKAMFLDLWAFVQWILRVLPVFLSHCEPRPLLHQLAQVGDLQFQGLYGFSGTCFFFVCGVHHFYRPFLSPEIWQIKFLCQSKSEIYFNHCCKILVFLNTSIWQD